MHISKAATYACFACHSITIALICELLRGTAVRTELLGSPARYCPVPLNAVTAPKNAVAAPPESAVWTPFMLSCAVLQEPTMVL